MKARGVVLSQEDIVQIVNNVVKHGVSVMERSREERRFPKARAAASEVLSGA